MNGRFPAILFSCFLAAALALGVFIEPAESQANLGIGWKGEYFANVAFDGPPAVITIDKTIEMNWSTAAPYSELPTDFFSVRWTTTANFDDAIYRFRVGADDGIRLLINDTLVIDAFQIGPFRTMTRDVLLKKGEHRVVIEYFEEMGAAGVLVEWAIADNPADVMRLETDSDDAPPTTAVEQPYAYIASNHAEIHTEPRETAERLARVNLYQRLPIIGISDDGSWYQSAFPRLDGFDSETAIYLTDTDPAALPIISTAPVQDAAPVEGIAASELKLRTAPGQYDELALIPAETSLRILSRDAEGTWFYIAWERDEDALEGWVYAPYVELTVGTTADLSVR